VNGNLVKSHALSHGDEIEIGRVRFLFFLPGESEEVVNAFHKRRMAQERLFALVPEAGGDEIEIEPLPFTVGRDEGCELRLDDESISSSHARFLFEDHHLVLEDLGSTNGSFVKGRRIDKSRVGHGTEIELGNLFYLIRDVDYPFPRQHRRSSSRHVVLGVSVVLMVLVLAVVVPLILGMGSRDDSSGEEPNVLRKNPSFESPPAAGGSLEGWALKGKEFSLDFDQAAHGKASLRVELPSVPTTWANAEAAYEDRLQVKAGKTYQVSCRLRAKYCTGVAGIRVDWFTKKGPKPIDRSYSDLITGDTGWLDVSTQVTAPRGATGARLSLVAKGTGGTNWFDHVRFAPVPGSVSGSLTKIGSKRVQVTCNRRGMASVHLDGRPVLSEVGSVFWDKTRVPRAAQELCLPASGYPRTGGGEFVLRAEAVKLSEGLPIPFEAGITSSGDAVRFVYRFHADAGRLVKGDRVAVALKVQESVQSISLAGKEGEERLGRTSFGSVSGVREITLRTSENGVLSLACDPPLTVNGLSEDGGILTIYPSVGVSQADLGRILEVTLTLAPPPDREEERAAKLIERAEGMVKAGKLGRAHEIYGRVRKEYGSLKAADDEARSRMTGIRTEFDRQRAGLEETFADFEAAPSPTVLSGFLFRLDEVLSRFEGMEGVGNVAAMRESALDAYSKVAGEGFAKARKTLAEAKAAYETDDWVRAESLCARILSESDEDAIKPGALAILSEIRRRWEDREESDAWVEGRVRAAKDLEARGEGDTAKEVYGEILKRYPRGEWAAFAREQIKRLER
jgi:pSer/pThr/pTyr-binding forkhead associated (FHA) protein